MHWTKYALLTLILVVMGAVSMFGAHFGWTVDGIPHAGGIGATPAFLGDMLSFRIDGMPVYVSGIFDIILILVILMAVNWARGTD